ncbi:MAG: hypothetical protein Q8O94_01805, partial [bacterium]|nr:hypothetical protein [bacterium]
MDEQPPVNIPQNSPQNLPPEIPVNPPRVLSTKVLVVLGIILVLAIVSGAAAWAYMRYASVVTPSANIATFTDLVAWKNISSQTPFKSISVPPEYIMADQVDAAYDFYDAGTFTSGS